MINLLVADAATYAGLVHDVAMLAAHDSAHGKPQRSGIALVKHFCSAWRKGHERHLRLVYTAARWQAETKD